MEENKAPKKIYLEAIYPNNGVLPNGLNYMPSPTDIEYTRTDIFIEKACEYFRTKKKCVFECIGENVYHSLLNEEEIDEFRKYMKRWRFN